MSEMKSCLYLEPRRLKFEPSGRANWEFAGNTSPWLESSLESPDQNKHNNPVGQWTKVTLVNVVCSLHRIPLRRLIHGSSHWKGQKFKSSSSRKKKEFACPLRTLSFEVGLVLSSAGLYYQRFSLPHLPWCPWELPSLLGFLLLLGPLPLEGSGSSDATVPDSSGDNRPCPTLPILTAGKNPDCPTQDKPHQVIILCVCQGWKWDGPSEKMTNRDREREGERELDSGESRASC